MGFWALIHAGSQTLLYPRVWPWLGLLAGLLLPVGWLYRNRGGGLLLMALVSTSVAVLGLPFFATPTPPLWHLALAAFEFALGVTAATWGLRHITTLQEHWRDRLTRRSALARESRTDIRTVADTLPNARQAYDPLTYCHQADRLFIGLDPDGQPVYLDAADWRRSHVDIVGMTGSGKGVLAGVLLTQAVRQGEAVFVLDPKDDQYAPHVMAAAARAAGVPYYFIDLGADCAQWNPAAHKSAHELEELLVSGFGLAERGTDADFYRLNDRRAARECAEMMVHNRLSLPMGCAAFRNHPSARRASKFMEDLEEISSVATVATVDGLDLPQAIEDGAVVYVRGSLRHPRIMKLQRMLVLSMLQHCEHRPRDRARHVCLFLDEFRYLISASALEALASIRDKCAHVVLAHQTLGDLRQVTGDLDPAMVASSVTENCAIKFTYRVSDPDTALWLARMSGQILTDSETRSLETDAVLAEREREVRSLHQTERYLVDTNMLHSLPERCAVCYGAGLAQFVFTSPIKVTRDKRDHTPSIMRKASPPVRPKRRPKSNPQQEALWKD